MTIPLRSMINTPSTPLCEEIRAIVSSISAAVDDSTAASLEELISTFCEIRTMTERPSVGTTLFSLLIVTLSRNIVAVLAWDFLPRALITIDRFNTQTNKKTPCR